MSAPIHVILLSSDHFGCRAVGFSDNRDLERFVELQGIANPDIRQGVGAEGITGSASAAVQDDGTVLFMRGDGHHLVDAFLDEIREGLTLWHVDIDPQTKEAKVLRAFTEKPCTVSNLRFDGTKFWSDSEANGDPFIVHCFATDKATATTIALQHFLLVHFASSEAVIR